MTLSEGLGDPRVPFRREFLPDLRLRTLDSELADSGPSRLGLAAALAAASAPPPSAYATGATHLILSMWGGVARPLYTALGVARNTRARRTYPVRGSIPVPRTGGHSGPPVGPMPLGTWEESAQLRTPRLVGPAVPSGLGRSLGDLPPILNNGADNTLIMALSRAYVRLRNEMVSVASLPMGDHDADRL